jgi:predicted amidophosphoribosyltransferase
MLQIDETTRRDHFNLASSDLCFYVWEYTAGRRYDFSPTNQLISNLKIKPTQITARPRRNHYKQQAINHCAAALRSLIQRPWVEQIGTFVPMPASKIPGHHEFDDRTSRLLISAFRTLNADIRPMLEQTESTAADHENPDRLSYAALRANMRINEAHAAAPLRANIAVVDDVLNSGKHFKVAQELLVQRFPGVSVIGIFLARCIRSDPS